MGDVNSTSYAGRYRGEHATWAPEGFEDWPMGDYWWYVDDGKRRLCTVLMGPCGSEVLLWDVAVQGPENPNPPEQRAWGWDGNVETPTLTPSLHWIDKWHGWMRAGRLESC